MNLLNKNNTSTLITTALTKICLGLLVTSCFGLSATSSYAQSDASVTTPNTTARLQTTVHRLNAWLRGKKEADAWRRYLLLNVLDTQSALGERADVGALYAIASRFSQGNKELEQPAFEDVKIAIDEHIKHLSQIQPVDLMTASSLARSQYNRISIASMSRQRDLAKSDLESLKQHYRDTLPSRQRAMLFYDLELDDAIEFLEGIEFELAPEISVGKVNSMIDDIEDQLDKVINKIDALPVTPEPDDEDEEEVKPSDDIVPLVVGPTPDDDDETLEELERDQKVLKDRVAVLKKQKTEIQKKDRPRQSRRIKTFRRLQEFEKNFVELSKSQTDPYFASATLSLEQFVRTYFFGTEDNLQEQYLVKLGELETELPMLQGVDSRDASGRVGELLNWLESTNQASSLVTAIRAQYSLPNIYIAVSGKLLNRLAAQDVIQDQPIRENFGGRLIRGRGTIRTGVSIELIDDPNQVHANIHLLGSINSNTFIEQGKLQVYTAANGSLEARRDLFANIGGLFASDAKVAATIRTMFSGTSSKLKIVNNIAAKKFAEVKAKGEAATSDSAEEQLESEFVEQTDQAVDQGQQALSRAQEVIANNAQLAPEIYLRSTASQIVVVGKKSSIATLGATSFPSQSPVPTDVGVRIHESLLSNYLDRTFSGKTFTDKQLAAEFAELTGGDIPPALEGDPDSDEDESFSITFSNIRPIQFEFEDNGFGVSISGRRFSQGDRKINAGLRIRLRFRIKQVDGKLKFVREGKPEIDYVGEKKDARAVAFRSFLLGRLNPKEGAEETSVDLPNNLLPIDQVEALGDSDIAKQMQLVQCRSENGWLYLGWNHQPANANFSFSVDLPAIWTDATIFQMGEAYIGEPNLNLMLDGAMRNQPPLLQGAPIIIGSVESEIQ